MGNTDFPIFSLNTQDTSYVNDSNKKYLNAQLTTKARSANKKMEFQ